MLMETNPTTTSQRLGGATIVKEASSSSNHSTHVNNNNNNNTTTAWMLQQSGEDSVQTTTTDVLLVKKEKTTATKSMEATRDAVGWKDDASSSSSSCTPPIVHPPPSRIEFVHVPKTGGTSVEVLGAKFGYQWGVCHYLRRIIDARVPCPPMEQQQQQPVHHPVYHVSNWHVPPRYIQPTRPQDNNNNTTSNDNNNDTTTATASIYNPYQLASSLSSSNTTNETATIGLFLVVRNPYDRIVSEFKYRTRRKRLHTPDHLNTYVLEKLHRLQQEQAEQHRNRPPELAYFMDDAHLIPQSDYLPDDDDDDTNSTTVHILHTEHLQSEWPCLVQRYGLPPAMANITHTNRSGSSSSTEKQQQLTRWDLRPPARALVESVYAQDFLQFGYPTMDQETTEKNSTSAASG